MSNKVRVVDGTVERLVFLCFDFTIAMCEFTADGWRERSFAYLVTATDFDDLFKQVRSAQAVLVHNLQLLGEPDVPAPYMGALHMRVRQILPLADDGRPLPASWPFFEWKHDFPGTLDDYLSKAKRAYAALGEVNRVSA